MPWAGSGGMAGLDDPIHLLHPYPVFPHFSVTRAGRAASPTASPLMAHPCLGSWLHFVSAYHPHLLNQAVTLISEGRVGLSGKLYRIVYMIIISIIIQRKKGKKKLADNSQDFQEHSVNEGAPSTEGEKLLMQGRSPGLSP